MIKQLKNYEKKWQEEYLDLKGDNKQRIMQMKNF
jgi:hypothetical protein